MPDQEKKRSSGCVIAAIALLALGAAGAFFGHRALQHVAVERFYDDLLAQPSIVVDRVAAGSLTPLGACERLLELWSGIQGERVNAAEASVELPRVLRLTRSISLPNDPVRRDQGITQIVVELEQLSGEKRGRSLDAWQQWLVESRQATSDSAEETSSPDGN